MFAVSGTYPVVARLAPVSIVMVGWYQALRYWTMRREAFSDVARNAVTRAAAVYDPFRDTWGLSTDSSVNYLAAAVRPASRSAMTEMVRT